jgi:hypothetical protein
MFVMFSTAAGATADDGEPGSRNSPFTRAFLMHIASPAALESVAKEISRETIALTRTNQRPYISDNILYVKDYSLFPSEGLKEIARPAAVPEASPYRPGTDAPPRPGAPQTPSPRPSTGAGAFSLDNASAWAVSLSFAANPGAAFDALRPGGSLRYTFWERFKTRGDLFIAPNAFFASFQAGGSRFGDTGGEGFFQYMPGAGALWRFRPHSSQRFILAAGLSANALLGSVHYAYYDQAFNEADDFLVEPMLGLHGEGAFRFTPLLALELNLGWYLDVLGPYPLQGGGNSSLNFLQGTLGVSVTVPYGK